MKKEHVFSKHKLMIGLMVILGLSVMMSAPLHVAAQNVAVDVGDSFTFVVNRFHQSVTVGAETNSADKFTIDGKNPTSPGSDAKITVEVVDISSGFFGDTITYEVSLGDAKVNATASVFATFSLMFLSVAPSFFLMYVTSSDLTFTPSDMNTDIEDFIPYIIPVNGTTDDIWNSFVEAFENQTTTRQDDNSDLTMESKNSRLGGNFEAFMRFEGTARNQTTNEELTFNSKVRFVYEMATGVLQGFKTDTTIEGTISNDTISINMDIEINREGYQIEGFGDDGGLPLPTPALEAPIVFFGLLAVTMVFSRIKKRQ